MNNSTIFQVASYPNSGVTLLRYLWEIHTGCISFTVFKDEEYKNKKQSLMTKVNNQIVYYMAGGLSGNATICSDKKFIKSHYPFYTSILKNVQTFPMLRNLFDVLVSNKRFALQINSKKWNFEFILNNLLKYIKHWQYNENYIFYENLFECGLFAKEHLMEHSYQTDILTDQVILKLLLVEEFYNSYTNSSHHQESGVL